MKRDTRFNVKSLQCLWSSFGGCIPIVSLTVAACLGQTPKQSVVLNSPIDRTTAVSFFWFGDMESHWRHPMNFYVASASDPRLHTVSVEHGLVSRGVETWITASEMQTLIAKLSRSHLEWMDSKTVVLQTVAKADRRSRFVRHHRYLHQRDGEGGHPAGQNVRRVARVRLGDANSEIALAISNSSLG
jgi:hypothetical protein